MNLKINDVQNKNVIDENKLKPDSLHFVTNYLQETDKLIEQTKNLKSLSVKTTYQVVNSIQELKKVNQPSKSVLNSTEKDELLHNETTSLKNQKNASSINHTNNQHDFHCAEASGNFTNFCSNTTVQSNCKSETVKIDNKINNTIDNSEKNIMSKLERLNTEFNSLCKNSSKTCIVEQLKPSTNSNTTSPRTNKPSVMDLFNNNDIFSNSVDVSSSFTDIIVPQLDFSDLVKSEDSLTDTKRSQNYKSYGILQNGLKDTKKNVSNTQNKNCNSLNRSENLFLKNNDHKKIVSKEEHNQTLFVKKNEINFSNSDSSRLGNFYPSHHNCTFDIIPNEMWLLIFSFLSFKDLFALRQSCSKFYYLANDSSLWRRVRLANKKLTYRSLKVYSSKSPRHLELINCNSKLLTNSDMRHFFQSMKTSLVSLSVISCSGKAFLGDNISLHVSCHCFNLRKIHIPWSSITNNGFSALVESLHLIEEIDISGNSLINDSSFFKFVEKHSTNLLNMQMEGCFNISPYLILKMVENSPKLKGLNISLCNRIDNQTCNKICSALPSICYLDVHGVKCFDDTSLNILSKNSVLLNTLIVGNCSEITDKGAVFFNRYGFKHLDISNCYKITDQSLLAQNFSQLELIDASSLAVSDTFIENLAYTAHKLHTIKVSYCYHITNDAFVKLISSMKNLKHVWAYGCKQINFSLLKEISPNLNFKM